MELKKEYYSVEEAMQILEVNRDTIYRYLGNGKLDSIKIGKRHKILKSSLEEFFKPISQKRKESQEN